MKNNNNNKKKKKHKDIQTFKKGKTEREIVHRFI